MKWKALLLGLLPLIQTAQIVNVSLSLILPSSYSDDKDKSYSDGSASGSSTGSITFLETLEFLDTNLFSALFVFSNTTRHIPYHSFTNNVQFTSLLNAALASRKYLPQILAQFSTYPSTDPNTPSCHIWAHLDGIKTCSLSNLTTIFQDPAASWSPMPSLPWDHVYRNAYLKDRMIIIYADVSHPDFGSWHDTMMARSDVAYVLRWIPPPFALKHLSPQLLGGYGEYKVTDDRKVNSTRYPHADYSSSDNHGEFNDPFLDALPPIIKAPSQLSYLALKSVQYIHSLVPANLSLLAHISLNFPRFAHILAEQTLLDKGNTALTLAQARANQAIIPSTQPIVWINGMQIELSSMRFNTFTLLKSLDIESRLIQKLAAFDIGYNGARALIYASLGSPSSSNDNDDSAAASASKMGDLFDFRDDTEGGHVLIWWNDLERDARYKSWRSSLGEILRPTYPGQLHAIRRNIYNIVFALDFTRPALARLYIEDAFLFVQRELPFHIATAVIVYDEISEFVGWAVYYVKKTRKKLSELKRFVDALVHIADVDIVDGRIGVRDVRDIYRRLFNGAELPDPPPAVAYVVSSIAAVAAAASSSVHDDGLSHDGVIDSLRAYTDRLGLAPVDTAGGGIFFNGIFIPLGDAASYKQTLMQACGKVMKAVQAAVRANLIPVRTGGASVDLLAFFLNSEHVLTRRNLYLVNPSTSGGIRYAEIDGDAVGVSVDAFSWVYPSKKPSLPAAQILISLVHIADYNTLIGLKSALELLRFLMNDDSTFVSSNNVRVAFLGDGDLPALAYALVHSSIDIDCIRTLHDIVQESVVNAALLKYTGPGSAQVSDICDDPGVHDLTLAQTRYMSEVLGIEKGDRVLIANGRVVGPFRDDYIFRRLDYSALVMQALRSVGPIHDIINQFRTVNSTNSGDNPGTDVANMIMKISAILGQANANSLARDPGDNMYTQQSEALESRVRMDWIDSWNGPIITAHTFTHLFNDSNRTSPMLMMTGNAAAADSEVIFDIVAVFDPITHAGQEICAILRHLEDLLSHTRFRILLNPQIENGSLKEDEAKLPITRFYRFVLGGSAVFTRIPEGPILTLGMDGWVVTAAKSVHDLDNINLADGSVQADFVLRYLLVQGHCREIVDGVPPRGLQFSLLRSGIYGNEAGALGISNSVEESGFYDDTITMANLGYFQLKAYPGVWDLEIREGRSRDIYEFESMLGFNSTENGAYRLYIADFEGLTIYPVVRRRLGMEMEDVLVAPSMRKASAESTSGKPLIEQVSKYAADSLNHLGVLKPLAEYLNPPFIPQEQLSANPGSAAINIFSVASGHLYERFMGIMMLSVMKNTKSSVKFWLIEDFLSPNFKWPHWLRAQSEKQRTIWGYKILFLDVLFPLTLEKIIFVDADQVVRTDMLELVNLDLKGHVYGYTPFCGSREEIEGFRFWKQGYWKSHLAGRPYHISALFVVDLQLFRQVAAGDRIRQQYQALSADENSLSNLDQDLPNNMIHQLPIFSLPQEWLWCETWCSDSELKYAKTIDLCNNPMTKEPKLARARRILPEWDSLDQEVQSWLVKDAEKVINKDAEEVINKDAEKVIETDALVDAVVDSTQKVDGIDSSKSEIPVERDEL